MKAHRGLWADGAVPVTFISCLTFRQRRRRRGGWGSLGNPPYHHTCELPLVESVLMCSGVSERLISIPCVCAWRRTSLLSLFLFLSLPEDTLCLFKQESFSPRCGTRPGPFLTSQTNVERIQFHTLYRQTALSGNYVFILVLLVMTENVKVIGPVY